MKKCAYCGGPIIGKQKTAKFCSDICRLRAYRVRHGISEPFEPKEGKKQARSEEHTSELQSRPHLVCRLLLEKKKRGSRARPGPRRFYSFSRCRKSVCRSR